MKEKDFSKERDHKDFSGLYIFYEKGRPLYVGISRCVIARLHQHTKGASHFSASWAFTLMLEAADLKIFPKESRTIRVSKNPKGFKMAKQRIQTMEVSIVPIKDAIQLYLFEVLLAIELGTIKKYNRFETH